MTPAQITRLRAELAADPEAYGYGAMSDETVTAVLNEPAIATYGEVALVEVNRALIMMSDTSGRFVWDNVLDAGGDPAHAAHDLARRLIFLFDGQLPIDWGGGSADSLLLMAAAAGFFTPAQAQTLKDTGKRLISRAEQLGLPPVRVGQVMEARP